MGEGSGWFKSWGREAVAAGAQALGAAGQWLGGKKRDKRRLQHQLQLSEYAYQKDKEMIDDVRKYNLPSAEMQRLRDAGLNPNLVYGTGTATESRGEMAKYNVPEVHANYETPNFGEIIGAYQNFKLTEAQIDNARESIETANILQDLKGIESHVKRSTWTDEVEKIRHETQKAKRDVQIKDAVLDDKSLDKIYKQYRNEFAKMGIREGDNLMIRLVAKMLIESGIIPAEALLGK